MRKLISEIVYSILTGKDYRKFVLATINKRFIDKVEKLTAEIFKYKKQGGNWLDKLLENTSKKSGKENKFKLLWYSGLNDKTVKNITGTTSRKEICSEIGKKNLESHKLLLSKIENKKSSCKMGLSNNSF